MFIEPLSAGVWKSSENQCLHSCEMYGILCRTVSTQVSHTILWVHVHRADITRKAKQWQDKADIAGLLTPRVTPKVLHHCCAAALRYSKECDTKAWQMCGRVSLWYRRIAERKWKMCMSLWLWSETVSCAIFRGSVTFWHSHGHPRWSLVVQMWCKS